MSDVRRRAVRVSATLATAAVMLLASANANAQDWRTASYSRQLSGEDRLHVNVEYGAGTLQLARAEPGTLYKANIRWDADGMTPRVSYRDGERRLHFGIEGKNNHRNLKGGELNLRLAPNVPLDLDLQFGAAEATLDLGGLLVRNASVQTGASRTTLLVSSPNREQCESVSISVGAAQFEARDLGNLNTGQLTLEGGVGEITLAFNGEWKRDMSASVEMGLGSLTLVVPTNLGVRVVRDGVLTSFDSEGLTKRGNVYTSQQWDSAEYKLTLDLDAALGSVKVRWVDP